VAKKPRRVLVEVLPRYNDPAAAWGTPGEPGDIITDGDGNQLATDLDYNRRKAALAFVDPTAAPPMEFIGARYVLNHTPGVVDPRWDGATQGDIVEFVAGELPTLNRWVAQTPIIGWSIYIRALNYDLIFDLTSTWAPRSFALPPHAPTHQHGGGDEVATVTPASNAIPKADGTGKLDPGWLPAVVVPVPSSRTITAGAGLVGGGDLTVDRTIDAAANADGSIIVNPDDIQVGVLATDGQHGVRGGGTQHALATPAVAGFMSPADKTKIDNVVTGPHTPLSNVAPLNVTKAPASAGGAVEASRQDHKHDVDTATAVELTDTTNAEGAATSLARSDHQHAHGNRGGGTLHALVTALAAGFMSAADKIKLDGLLPGGGVEDRADLHPIERQGLFQGDRQHLLSRREVSLPWHWRDGLAGKHPGEHLGEHPSRHCVLPHRRCNQQQRDLHRLDATATSEYIRSAFSRPRRAELLACWSRDVRGAAQNWRNRTSPNRRSHRRVLGARHER